MIIRVNLLVEIPDKSDEGNFNKLLQQAYAPGKIIVLHDKKNNSAQNAIIQTVTTRRTHARDLRAAQAKIKVEEKERIPDKEDGAGPAEEDNRIFQKELSTSSNIGGRKRNKVRKPSRIKKHASARNHK